MKALEPRREYYSRIHLCNELFRQTESSENVWDRTNPKIVRQRFGRRKTRVAMFEIVQTVVVHNNGRTIIGDPKSGTFY